MSHFMQASKVTVKLTSQLKPIPPASDLVFGKVSLRSTVASKSSGSGVQNAVLRNAQRASTSRSIGVWLAQHRLPAAACDWNHPNAPQRFFEHGTRPLVPPVANDVSRL